MASGSFGKWIQDEFDLPAYQYECLHTKDPNARTQTTGKDSTDHWHQVGNDRITLTAHNDGRVQFFFSDRSLQWISIKDTKKNTIGGGITFIEENNHVFSDLFKKSFENTPENYKRIFGCGYFKKIMIYNNLKIEHFIFPPHGNDPVVISEVKITNLSKKTRNLTVHEFWNTNFKNLISTTFSMLYLSKERTKFGQTKLISLLLRAIKNVILTFQLGGEQVRERFHKKFKLETEILNNLNCMILKPTYKKKIPVKKDDVSDRNYYQYPIFLAALDEGNEITYANDLKLRKNTPDTNCLMVGQEIQLKSSETKHLKFIFGTSNREDIENLITKHKNFDRIENFSKLKGNLMDISYDKFNWLSREVQWHSNYMRSAILYDNFFKCHHMLQGNAYGFIHGLNGAVRDFVIFLIPMIYQEPFLAREMLEYMLKNMTEGGELPYANEGFGKQSGVFVHETSSDLYLFLLWGIIEYVYFTRDFNFLDKEIEFYPPSSNKKSSVFHKMELALKYLFKKVGIGAHGLIKVGSGDWSDGITLFVKNRKAFIKHGESSFNTGFALYLLPKLLKLFEKRNPKIKRFLLKLIHNLEEASKSLWNGKWLYRGWDGKNHPIGEHNIFLEHHAWYLLSLKLDDDKNKSIINSIYKFLDNPSRTGQYLLYPPGKIMLDILPPGWDVNGGIWPAMNFLLTWAYSKHDTKKALNSIYKNSMERRAEVYPNIWYGIWSGSDSYNAEHAKNPGETFIHPATPQVDFPIMNLNLHCGFLGMIIKGLIGIEANHDEIIISPIIEGDFTFKTPNLFISQTKNKIEGYFKPITQDQVTLKIKKPKNWTQESNLKISQIKDKEFIEIFVDKAEIHFSIPKQK